MERRYYFVDKEDAFKFMMVFGGHYKKVAYTPWNIDSFPVEYKEDKEKVIQSAKEKIQPVFKEFFEDNPDVKLVTWTQFTPFFNDGAPCEFSMHEIFFATKTWKEGKYDCPYDIEDNKEGIEHEYYRGSLQAMTNTQIACKELAWSLAKMESLFEEIFGDHCQVLVEREGISVQEYDHD